MIPDNPQFAVDRGIFFAGNDNIHQLRPSLKITPINESPQTATYCLTARRILSFIYNIFKQIYDYFIGKGSTYISQASGNAVHESCYPGIVAAFDRESNAQRVNLELLPPHQLIGYFQRFIDSDESTSNELRICVDHLQKQFTHLNNPVANPQFLDNLITDLLQMKRGEKRLVLANRNLNDQVFYLFSKEANGINLKIIGRGPSMIDLTGIEEVSAKGKAKIPSSITYQNIPSKNVNEQWLRALLMNSSLGIQFNSKAVEKLIKPFDKQLVEQDLQSNLSKRTGNYAKTFWAAFQQVADPKGSNKKEHHKFKLRIQLGCLFQMYQDKQGHLKADSYELKALVDMLRSASENALRAFKKGYITQPELDEIVKELTIIHEGLSHIQNIELPALAEFRDIKETLYSKEYAKEASVPQQVAPPQPTQKPAQARVPQTELSNDLFGQISLVKGKGLILDKAIALQQLREIDAAFDSQDLIETVTRLEFSPYLRNQKPRDMFGLRAEHYDQNNRSMWISCSQPEATAFMELFNRLSEKLVSQMQKEGKLSIDGYESLLKISAIVLLLNSRFYKKKEYVMSNLNLDKYFQQLYGKLNTSWLPNYVSKDDEKRSGHRVEFANYKIFQELKMFGLVHKIEESNDPAYEDVGNNFKFALKQTKLLDDLRMSTRWKDWIRPFKHSALLAAFLKVGIDIREHTKSGEVIHLFSQPTEAERKAEKERNQLTTNRADGMKVQEAIVDDPEKVAEFIVNELNQHNANKYDFDHKGKDPILPRHQQAFSKEEMTDLLLLLRNKHPQTEIIAFIEKRPVLLEQPEVRNFIEMLFFNRSIIETLENRIAFRDDLPKVLSNKIDELAQKSLKDSKYIDQLLFFMSFQEKLCGIYNDQKYKNEAFNRIEYHHALVTDILNMALFGNHINSAILENRTHLYSLRTSEEEVKQTVNASVPPQPNLSVESYLYQLLTYSLNTLLKKDSLSGSEIARVILEYNLLQNTLRQNNDYDPKVLDFIDAKYKKVISQFPPANAEAYVSILDTLCFARKLPLDDSRWEGQFPHFRNAQYTIDLSNGQIKNRVQNQQVSILPNGITADPLWSRTFPDLDPKSLEVIRDEVGGISVFQFQDKQGFASRVEESAGKFRFYKIFPSISADPLQSLPTEKLVPITGNSLRELLRHKLYINSKNPGVGYIINNEGKLLFKLFLKETPKGLAIEKVTDCRKDPKSGDNHSMTLNNGADVDHPVIKRLAQFENQHEILVWRNAGRIEKIELPRYGLTFELDGETLIHKEPKASYKVNLSASVKEKQGYSVALLLEPLNDELPKKLLVPYANQIVMGQETPEIAHAQPSRIMSIFRRNVNAGNAPTPNPIAKYAFLEYASSLSHFSVNLAPQTNEIVCEHDHRIKNFLELSQLAIRLGQPELAQQMLFSMKLKKEDLTKQNIRMIVDYLKTLASSDAIESSIKLQFVRSIQKLIKGDGRHNKLRDGLKKVVSRHFIAYLSQAPKLEGPFKLSDKLFDRFAKIVKKTDPEKYQQYVAEFFAKGDYKYPVQRVKHDPVRSSGSKKYDYSTPGILFDESKSVSKEHCERKKFYTFDGYEFYGQNILQVTAYFLPLYKSLIEEGLETAQVQAIKHSLLLMSEGQKKPSDVHEMLLDLLNIIMRAKEEGVSLSGLPKTPAEKEEEKDGYTASYKYEEPIREWLLKLFPEILKLKQKLKIEDQQDGDAAVAAVASNRFEPEMKDDGERKAAAEEEEKAGPQEVQDPLDTDIQHLEESFKLHGELKPEDLSRTFKLNPEGPSLLFSQQELAAYSESETVKLPEFQLPPMANETSSCEKESLANLEKHMHAYRTKRNGEKVHFLTDSKEKLKELHRNLLQPKISMLLQEMNDAKADIERIISTSNDPTEQARIYAKLQLTATHEELMLAMLQDNLEGLKAKKKLPAQLDCAILKKALIKFYDKQVRLHLLKTCAQKIEEKAYTLYDKRLRVHMLKANTPDAKYKGEWETTSKQVFELLTSNRRYDAEESPQLLLFEAYTLQALRNLNNDKHQLDLLLSMLSTPQSVIQAVTGAGKTKVMSVVRSLMKANGENLVTMKIMPALYNQTLEIMKQILGDTFNIAIYPLRFDYKMPLVEQQKIHVPGNKNDAVIEASIFKKMYRNMLQTMQNRGTIISDYKSFPLLEEKFIKLNREFMGMRKENRVPSAIEIEHWTYLRKILVLLSKREDSLMDEFDLPNRPIHRIQTQMIRAEQPAGFLVEETLKLYDLLLKEPELHLKDNLQGEISKKARSDCIYNVARKVAREFAHPEQEVLDYLMGAKNGEAILGKLDHWSDTEKDKLTFYKDQFCTYLPLTLSYSRLTRYKRTPDGKRILPCFNGEKHDAKFGSILEEMNYMAQDYIQSGVTEIELQDWINDRCKELRGGSEHAKEQFAKKFPDKKLENVERYKISELREEIKSKPESVRFFLERRLKEIRSSGSVISMDPHNNVSMSRVVSGLSATLGSSDALHPQFKVDADEAGLIRAEMVYRLLKRTDGQQELIVYDPKNPAAMLRSPQLGNIEAVIDGAGAFKEFDSETVAKEMLKSQPHLKFIQYHTEDGKFALVGDHTQPGKGFFFSQQNTRGADAKLQENATGALTVNDQGTSEDLSQQEGRMRGPGQKVKMIRSKYAPHLRTVVDVIAAKSAYEARKQSEDLFKAKKQDLHNIVRTQAKKRLLEAVNLDACLDEFEKLEGIFITPSAPTYEVPGSYFRMNQHIRRCDKEPEKVLDALREKLVATCKSLGLTDAVAELNARDYTPFLKKMPSKVYSLEDSPDLELEVELEEELELEQQLEVEAEDELEFEVENELENIKNANMDVPYYLARTDTKVNPHSLSKEIHRAFDPRIEFTESFLPLTRKDPIYKRKPFDEKMYQAGAVHVKLGYSANAYMEDHSYWGLRSRPGHVIEKVTIGDLLDDIHLSKQHAFIYDIRTGKVTANLNEDDQSVKPEISRIMQSDDFRLCIAQIKFLNGQVEKYSVDEIKLMKEWLMKSGLKQMRAFFEKEVLRYRTESRDAYPCSQLWNLFEGAKA